MSDERLFETAETVENSEIKKVEPLFDGMTLFLIILVGAIGLGIGLGLLLSNWMLGLVIGTLCGFIGGAVTALVRKKR